jgi:Fe-S cluster biogenesis protein NfuA
MSTMTTPGPLEQVMERIERGLDGIRPYIASHRGAVEVVDFDPEDGRLTLRLSGTCHGCAAASITLRHGIEVRLRDLVPEVRVVEAV